MVYANCLRGWGKGRSWVFRTEPHRTFQHCGKPPQTQKEHDSMVMPSICARSPRTESDHQMYLARCIRIITLRLGHGSNPGSCTIHSIHPVVNLNPEKKVSRAKKKKHQKLASIHRGRRILGWGAGVEPWCCSGRASSVQRPLAWFSGFKV